MDNHVNKVPLTCGTQVSHRTQRVNGKTWFLGGGVHTKNYLGEGLPKKGGGLGQYANLRGGLARKRGGGVFLRGKGVDTPLQSMKFIVGHH